MPPHAPCRLQPDGERTRPVFDCFASTRSVQIATPSEDIIRKGSPLCLHTLRADCNHETSQASALCQSFASTRSVQIATNALRHTVRLYSLCLHTLRADCNVQVLPFSYPLSRFASTRSVQIATQWCVRTGSPPSLCLHTLRADCNATATRRNHFRQSLPPHAPCRLQRDFFETESLTAALPPHAPCRLQHVRAGKEGGKLIFASTRSVQIATKFLKEMNVQHMLCLHTLRADCNGRNAQNCNIHFSERVLSR